MPDDYDEDYYAELLDGSRRSAERILPIVFDLVRPGSVVDFGCGSGAWLAVANRLGAEIFGGDGPWVAPDMLEIPAERFRSVDLREETSIGRAFDLAICVEVAEHLPASAAETLVTTLTGHAPAILFSGAVPGQGGLDHVNETWPDKWRDLFASKGFDCHDVLRGRVWNDDAIEIWYRQNLLLFLRRDWAADGGGRSDRLAAFDDRPLSIVHPEYWMERHDRMTFAEADRDRAWTEVRELKETRTDLTGRVAALSDKNAALAGRNMALADENATLVDQNRALTDEIARISGNVDGLTAQLAAMQRSRSWRLTEPLRRLRRRLRRVARR